MLNTTEPKEEYDVEKWTLFLETVIGNDVKWLQILTIVLIIIFFVVGVVGNTLTCIVIFCDKRMHTTTNFYLFHMAVTDLLVSFGIFIEIYVLMDDYYVLGSIACKLHFFFVVLLWNNSILVMTILAIERYLAIWYPLFLNTATSLKRVLKMITAIWIIAICETVPELFIVELVKTDKVSVCFTVPSSLARIINGVLAFVTFIIPLTIMLFVYIMIALKVNSNQKSNSKKNIFNHKDNRGKVNKLVVAITLSFLICWLPFFTFRLLYFFYDMNHLMQLGTTWNISYRSVLLNSWLSIILNPILFSLMSTKFRKALSMLWKKSKMKTRTEVIYL